MATDGLQLRRDDAGEEQRGRARAVWLVAAALAAAALMQILVTEFSRGAPRPDGTFGAPLVVGTVRVDDPGAFPGQPRTLSFSAPALLLNLVATAAPLFAIGHLAGRTALILAAAGGTLGVVESIAQFENVRRTSSLLVDRPYSEVGAIWVNALIGMILVASLWWLVRALIDASPAFRALLRRLLAG